MMETGGLTVAAAADVDSSVYKGENYRIYIIFKYFTYIMSVDYSCNLQTTITVLPYFKRGTE